jgi:hypothetical protein
VSIAGPSVSHASAHGAGADEEVAMQLATRVSVAAIVLSSVASSPALAQGRLRPPAFVTCDRNHLTSFTGRVVTLSRDSETTKLRLDTDERTQEQFTLRHPGADASAWFYASGKPFAPGDWATLLPAGKLRPGTRVTIWVCDNEPNPKVDVALPQPPMP